MSLLASRKFFPILQRALKEDQTFCDVTSRAVLPSGLRIRARIIAKTSGILAGGPVAEQTFRTVDRSLRCGLRAKDGAKLVPGQTILTVEGRARSIFAAERTALNVLGHLSGIATLTRRFVERVRGTRAHILDTRKTLPGLRMLEKYAVRAGGGQSHRASLAEAVLIKTNQLQVLGQGTGDRGQVIQKAIADARRRHPGVFIEVEVANLRELRAALDVRPNAILLDNMTMSMIRAAVKLRRHMSHVPNARMTRGPVSPLLEVSGGVTLANVRAIAKTGVERISIGRLTQSAPALDVALHVMARVRTR